MPSRGGIRGNNFKKGKNKKRNRQLGELKFDKDGKKIDDRDTEEGKNQGFSTIIRENKVFESFYKAQKFCASEEEFEEFLKVMRSDLPASFRITGSRSHAASLRKIIEGQFISELSEKAALEQETVAVPKVLPWYPDNLAYQLNVTRKDIRRMEVYWKLHNFLISCTDTGGISRQETVSMIPPLVLGVEPHHKVLDMCAAPGSKTAQLIEALHEGVPRGTLPSGLVVANDQDNSRCYLLTHQAKRLQSPCLLITNHDASVMPNIMVPNEATPEDMAALVPMKYDRILCDAPCTGDGTLRKNADIWPKWNPVNSVNLHGIQYKIAKRGLELLTVGGFLVYSTCSLNPIEDEAVLSRILQETGDSVRLVEIRDKLTGLVCSSGLQTWVCASKQGEIYKTWDEVPEKIGQTQIRPYMFPPSDPEVLANLHLDRSVRILPHHQNTGGFFVALLEKVSLCPWESKRIRERSDDLQEDISTDPVEPPKKKQKHGNFQSRGFKEDPFVYFQDNNELFPQLKEYYSLNLPCRNFMTRNKHEESIGKTIYFTSALIRDIIENNNEKIKLINSGVKAFVRADNKGSRCDYRIAQEGAISTVPFLGDRLVHPSKEDMVNILQAADIDKPPPMESFSDPDFKAELEKLDTGSIAYVFIDPDTGMSIEIIGWKGKNSVRAYVVKNERLHYLRLLGADIPEQLVVNKFDKLKEGGEDQLKEEESVKELKEEGVDKTSNLAVENIGS